MAGKTIKMEKLKLVLKLRSQGIKIKAIARQTGLSRNTVKKYLERSQNAQSEEQSINQQVNDLLTDDTSAYKGKRFDILTEHFKLVEKELLKTGVTRQILWKDYNSSHSEAYSYSQYCLYLKTYLGKKEVVMHLDHAAGERVMIDFAGKKLSYVDTHSGELIACQVFVSVLPHSGLIFCKAVHSQNSYDFADCINSMLLFYQGSPQTILCDNLKTAVSRPGKYEPVFTELCYQLSEHYNTHFSATRPYHPRDKAMVEGAVKIIYNHIYGPLRNNVSRSLEELNSSIAEALILLNTKRYKGSAFSRLDLYLENEKHLLTPLPCEVFQLKKTTLLTVQRNYHVQLGETRHYYSVPFRYAAEKVKVLYDQHVIEIYHKGERIALHQRGSITKSYHTQFDHMPSNHQQSFTIKGWTKEELIDKAKRIGPLTAQVAEHILSSSIFQEQNFKSCFGLTMLNKKYEPERIENACQRALTGTRIRYATIRDILERGLDRQTELFDPVTLPDHDNIRGPSKYQ